MDQRPDERPTGGYSFEDLLNTNPNILTIIDPVTYRVHFQNRTGNGKIGNICGEVCHRKIVQLEAPCPFCNMSKAVSTGVMQTSEVELPDGTWVMIQFSPIRHQSGATHVAETIVDITEQKHREQELARLTGTLAGQVRKLTDGAP
ncbi:MAG: hypothetical protein E6K60_10855 [Nitrospirae bacterium]|nr:MAG: hypothetical protein E6K60_10855 [Nitrospirota bacterium]